MVALGSFPSFSEVRVVMVVGIWLLAELVEGLDARFEPGMQEVDEGLAYSECIEAGSYGARTHGGSMPFVGNIARIRY
jgi:hypothetical protein